MVFSKEIDEILSAGYFLEDYFINNWAFCKEECLRAIDKLEAIGVAILGVDTFFEERLNPTGDTSYCDKKDSESDRDYFERSIREARAFVSIPVYGGFQFILVPKERLQNPL